MLHIWTPHSLVNRKKTTLESDFFPAQTGNISVQLYSNTLPTSGNDLFRCSNHSETNYKGLQLCTSLVYVLSAG